MRALAGILAALLERVLGYAIPPVRPQTLPCCMKRRLPSCAKQHQDACRVAQGLLGGDWRSRLCPPKRGPAPRDPAFNYSSPPTSPAHRDRRLAASGVCPSPARDSANTREASAIDESEETPDPFSASKAAAAAAAAIAAAAATAGDALLASLSDMPEFPSVHLRTSRPMAPLPTVPRGSRRKRRSTHRHPKYEYSIPRPCRATKLQRTRASSPNVVARHKASPFSATRIPRDTLPPSGAPHFVLDPYLIVHRPGSSDNGRSGSNEGSNAGKSEHVPRTFLPRDLLGLVAREIGGAACAPHWPNCQQAIAEEASFLWQSPRLFYFPAEM